MEFAAEVSSSTNIYNTLSGDGITTFTKEEIELNSVYNDVALSEYERNKWLNPLLEDREEKKMKISMLIGSDRAIKKDHPSKEFVLSGGLRRVATDRVTRETQARQTQPFSGKGIRLGTGNEPTMVTTLEQTHQQFGN